MTAAIRSVTCLGMMSLSISSVALADGDAVAGKGGCTGMVRWMSRRRAWRSIEARPAGLHRDRQLPQP